MPSGLEGVSGSRCRRPDKPPACASALRYSERRGKVSKMTVRETKEQWATRSPIRR